ncbi:MAG: helix-turn-helix transcriptional regulator [Oscillospiraceae bacterium]|nr:helix-turn-helix transcriptional regulator [Oscillospiraceae bacterium]
MSPIGKNIRNERNKIGFTQDELAEKLCVTRQAVSSWENSKTEPDIETISKMSELFGVNSDDLIGISAKNQMKRYKNSKAFRAAIIFGIASTLLYIFILFATQPAYEAHYRYFEGELYYFLQYIIKPLAGFFLGLTASFFIDAFTGFYIQNKIIKTIVLISGVLIFLFSTFFIVYFVIVTTASLELPLGFSAKFFFYQHKIITENYLIHALPPMLIYFGFTKKGVKNESNL